MLFIKFLGASDTQQDYRLIGINDNNDSVKLGAFSSTFIQIDV